MTLRMKRREFERINERVYPANGGECQQLCSIRTKLFTENGKSYFGLSRNVNQIPHHTFKRVREGSYESRNLCQLGLIRVIVGYIEQPGHDADLGSRTNLEEKQSESVVLYSDWPQVIVPTMHFALGSPEGQVPPPPFPGNTT
jgi:hypothetical protein